MVPPNRLRRARLRGRIGLVVCGVLVCLVCGWLGTQAAYPFVLASRLRAANDALETMALRYRLQNQRAEQEIKALHSQEGILRAARKLGWVLPNERKLRIPDISGSQPPPSGAEETTD